MTATVETKVRKDYKEQRKAVEERVRQAELARLKAIEEREKFYGLQVEPEVEYYEEVAHREPGDTNWVGFGFDIHPHVTFAAAALLLLFVAWTLLAGEQAASVFNSLLSGISSGFGWLYIAAANIFVIAMAFFAFSNYGKIRIGGPDAKPEFYWPYVLERSRTNFPLWQPISDVWQ
jgi:choline/glycine/proline betaine transport protein